MATTKAAPNYTTAQEKALVLAFKNITTMSDDDKRAEVTKQAKAMGKTARSIISKLSTLDGTQWVPYTPKAASSVKRGPTRQERVNTIQAMLGLDKSSLTSLPRALADDLAVLCNAITNLQQAAKVASKDEAESAS